MVSYCITDIVAEAQFWLSSNILICIYINSQDNDIWTCGVHSYQVFLFYAFYCPIYMLPVLW